MWLKEYYEVLGAATKKAQAYTDQEVSKVRTKFAVVASYADLPSPGRTDTIYLVPKAGFVSVYDQYIYENGQYTDIGDTELDLDSYATDLELSQGLATKVDKVEGYGLSKNDFTDAKDTKLASIETGAQVNVNPDSELDKTSTNAIQNKVVTEKFEEVEAEILNEDKVAEGNPITIETGSVGTAKSTELTMTPIQDFNGYDKPWVGGAGKNLCRPFTSGTSNNVTLTQNADGSITLSGTSSSLAAMFTVPLNTPSGTTVSISLNNSTTNSEVLVRLTDVANARYGTTVLADAVNKKSTFTTTMDYKEINVAVKTNHGNVSPITLKVQVEFSNAPTDWTPWENICPISGRTQSEVVRCGKNLLEIADGVNTTTTQGNVTVKTANNGEITLNGSMGANPVVAIWNLAWLGSSANPQSDNKKHLYNGTYKCTNLVPGMRIQIMGSNAEDANTTNTYAIASFYVGHETVTLNTSYKYVWLRLYLDANSSFNNVTFAPMIYQTDYSDSTYAPYTKQVVTIPFGFTIYGGTLDVETGVLSVDYVLKEFNGEEAITTVSEGTSSQFYRYIGQDGAKIVENAYNCSHFANAEITTTTTVFGCYVYTADGIDYSRIQFRPNISGVTDVTTFKTWLRTQYTNGSPVQVAFKISTPITTTLTAAQVNLLKGINNISTDADRVKMIYSILDLRSDWNEEDSSADDYIKNKPDLNAYAEKDTLWGDATISGNPVTLKTHTAQVIKNTELSILPVQDLHGYEKPWAGGNGKNLLPMTVDGIKSANPDSDTASWSGNTYTSQGMTYTILTDNDNNVTGIKVNGTASPTALFWLGEINYVANTAMKFNSGVNISATEVFFRICGFNKGNYDINLPSHGEDHTLNLESSGKIWGQIRVASGNTVNDMVFKPYVFLDSNPMTEFEPYSNICTISGRTQAEIKGCGKNLVKFPDTDTTVQGVTYLSNNNALSIKRTGTGTADSSPWGTSIIEHYNTMHWGPFPAGTYSVIVKNFIGTTVNDRIIFYAKYEDNSILAHDQRISGEQGQIANGSGRKYTFTATKPFKCCTWIRIPTESTIDCVANVQMEYGTEITDIVPYIQNTNVTIPFGSTIYGGSLNVETGLLSVEWAYIASYNGETITEPWISDRDEYIPNTTPSTGAKVAYKLASPTTTTLTTAQISLLKGINNIYTNVDSISFTYFNDVESLVDVDNKINEKSNLTTFGPLEEGPAASTNYAEGDYMIFEGKFCKASSAITAGDTLEIGTNLTETTIAAELLAIISQLPTT